MRCTTYTMDESPLDGIVIQRTPFLHIAVGDEPQPRVSLNVRPKDRMKRRVPVETETATWRFRVDRKLESEDGIIHDAFVGLKSVKGRNEPCLFPCRGNTDLQLRRLVHLKAAPGFQVVRDQQQGVTLLGAGLSGSGSVHEYLVILEAGGVLELVKTKPDISSWLLEFESSGMRLRGYSAS